MRIKLLLKNIHVNCLLSIRAPMELACNPNLFYLRLATADAQKAKDK